MKGLCSCGSCDPCNCALYCSDKRLNKLYGSGLTVGTCQCRLSTNGENRCQTRETQCVCSSPPPQGFNCNCNSNPYYQTVDGSGTGCGSDSGFETGFESGTESGSGSSSGTETPSNAGVGGSVTNANIIGVDQIVIKRKSNL